MMLDKNLIDVADHDMADQLKHYRFPPSIEDRKRTILSPHFDLDRQQIIDPKHLPELISEIEYNIRIPLFEKEIMMDRL